MKTTMVNTETNATYSVAPLPSVEEEDAILVQAEAIMRRRWEERQADKVTSPSVARRYLLHTVGKLGHEQFGLILLDNQHAVLGIQPLFDGTIDSASVYPREVIKAALNSNAAAVIFYHNHPSGDPSPSQADREITKRLVDGLGLVDIRVLDHVIVGAGHCFSFAEVGLI